MINKQIDKIITRLKHAVNKIYFIGLSRMIGGNYFFEDVAELNNK